MFQNYRIPRDSLLNKSADVSPEGQYISSFKDPRKRMGKNLVIHSFHMSSGIVLKNK
jgi:acyl-CoA oxidase